MSAMTGFVSEKASNNREASDQTSKWKNMSETVYFDKKWFRIEDELFLLEE